MFKNREQAGKLLAEKLKKAQLEKGSIVIAIPRGGVVVGEAVAKELAIPIYIMVIKKIGSPSNPELAIGAVAPENTVFWDEKLIFTLSINEKNKKDLLKQKEKEREEKEKLLGMLKVDVSNKMAIVVDDGVATGSTVIAASMYLEKKDASQVILAVPVIAKDTLSRMRKYYNKVIYLEAPSHFYAVGEFYEEFPEVTDEEVVRILSSKIQN